LNVSHWNDIRGNRRAERRSRAAADINMHVVQVDRNPRKIPVARRIPVIAYRAGPEVLCRIDIDYAEEKGGTSKQYEANRVFAEDRHGGRMR
jgi:hypothetical protein